MKNQYIGGNCLKRGGVGQFADIRKACRKRGCGVFERGVDPLMHTRVPNSDSRFAFRDSFSSFHESLFSKN